MTSPAPAPVGVIDVYGLPAPQGSKRHVGNGVMIESSKKVKPWRAAVEYTVGEKLTDQARPVLSGPVEIHFTFYLPRPKSAKKRPCPAVKPDLDKLVRSTLDALTSAQLYEDDSRVVKLTAEKLYLDTWSTRGPGCRIVYRQWVGVTPKL